MLRLVGWVWVQFASWGLRQLHPHACCWFPADAVRCVGPRGMEEIKVDLLHNVPRFAA